MFLHIIYPILMLVSCLKKNWISTPFPFHVQQKLPKISDSTSVKRSRIQCSAEDFILVLCSTHLGMVLHSVAEPVVAVAEVYILVAGTVDTFDLFKNKQ